MASKSNTKGIDGLRVNQYSTVCQIHNFQKKYPSGYFEHSNSKVPPGQKN